MKRMFGRQLHKRFKDLRADEKGSILIQTSLVGAAIIGMLGIGVDLSRAYLYRSQLSGALDAAALAGAKSFHSATRDAEIQAFFDSNFDAEFMGGDVADLTITEVDAVNRSLTVETSGNIDTVFMRLFGFDDLGIAASAETTSRQTGLQLVMVLDNTGSMRSSDGGTVRIDALQTASTSLVNSLFGTDDSNDELEIAILPYVTTVNVGHLLDPAYMDMTDMPPGYTISDTDKTKWYGCVEARATNADLSSDDAYDVKVEHDGEDWVPFLWKPHYNNLYNIDGLVGPAGETWKDPDYSYHGENGNDSDDGGPNINCPAPALDFTSTKSDLTTYIDDKLKHSYSSGGTIANIGMVWGWRMLHTGAPFFNDVEYDDDRMVKAAVLMTDGYNWVVGPRSVHAQYDGRNRSDDNDDAYDDDGDGWCPQCVSVTEIQEKWVCTGRGWRRRCGWEDVEVEIGGPAYDDNDEDFDNGNTHGGDYSAYGIRDEGRLDGATSSAGTQDAINDRLAYVCSAMKGMGVTLYTITFGEDIAGSDANAIELRNLYEGCATDTGKYFHAPTASQLEGAFEAIANDLADLRLSK